jgi:hypothetical protein
MATCNEGFRIAQLFASLGLDASALDEGLQQSRIKLEQFKKPVKDVKDALIQMEKAVGGFQNLNKILDQIRSRGELTAKSVYELYEVMKNVSAKPIGGRELIDLGKADIVDQLIARATRRAEMERERVARRAERAEMERKGLIGMGRFDALFKSMASLQMGGEMLGLNIPFFATSLISQAPRIASVIAKAFPVFLGISFFEILKQIGDKLRAMILDWRGYGEAAREAMMIQFVSSQKAMSAFVEYEDKLSSTYLAKYKGKELKDMTGTQIEYLKAIVSDSIEEERRKAEILRQNIAELESYSSLRMAVQMGPMEGAVRGGIVNARAMELLRQGETVESQKEKLEAVLDVLESLSKKWEELEIREIVNNLAEIKDNTKEEKRVDRITELPWRIPWFMGPRPEDIFASSFAGGSTMGGAGIASRALRSIRPPSGLMSATRGVDTITPAAASFLAGGIVFSPTYAPSFNFDGIPADVEKFMREKAEPAMLRHMENNANGIMADLKRILKANGVVVNS